MAKLRIDDTVIAEISDVTARRLLEAFRQFGRGHEAEPPTVQSQAGGTRSPAETISVSVTFFSRRPPQDP